MHHQSTTSAAEVQSNLKNASTLALDLLLPASQVANICVELNYKFRERVYSPMVTVWMFITQVLSADHSCQQAVVRLNAWRVARGRQRVSSVTTSYCKVRCRLVELHIRSLKTQMQMDHLRCQSPQMVRKEIHCHMIGYNLVRAAILASALKFNLCPSQLSFTGAMQAVEEFAATLRLQSGRREDQWLNLLETIREMPVGDRPGRSEPRELKRRPKQYKLMQTPRSANRNLYAEAA